MDKLDDFNFDESSVNNSTLSLASTDDLQNKYSKVTNPMEQLQILYDVRLREIKTLKEDYENYKIEKTKEIEYLKNKLLTYKADFHQLKISLKNAEELLGKLFMNVIQQNKFS